jgi:hypothetical protein
VKAKFDLVKKYGSSLIPSDADDNVRFASLRFGVCPS